MTDLNEEYKRKQANFEKLVLDESFPHNIMEILSTGGSILELCRECDVSFATINRYLTNEHGEAYAQAKASAIERDKLFVIETLRAMADFRIQGLYDDQGRIKPLSEWPPGASMMVQNVESIETLSDGEVVASVKKVRTEARTKVIELMGKVNSQFKESVQHSADDSLSSVLAQTVARGPKA